MKDWLRRTKEDLAYNAVGYLLMAAIAFGTIWMGYEQYRANHIMIGIPAMGYHRDKA